VLDEATWLASAGRGRLRISRTCREAAAREMRQITGNTLFLSIFFNWKTPYFWEEKIGSWRCSY
jgi:hypothetical protein